MRSTAASLALCVLIASPALTQTVDRIDREFQVSGVPTVIVENDDGRVHLSSHDGAAVVVRVTKEVTRAASDAEARERAAEVDVEIEQQGDAVVVRSIYPKSFWKSWRDAQVLVHIEIQAPRTSDLDIHNDDGPVTIEGFDGEHRVRVDDGPLEISDSTGKFEINAEDGDVRLLEVNGDVSVTADDGDLTLRGAFRSLSATADDGTVDIRILPASDMAEDWSIRAEDGSVRLELPEGFAADLDLRADDGSIEVDSSTAIRSTREGHLRSSLNGGGRTLKVRTDDGSIRVKQP